jgi:hypothetical protein
MIYSGYVVWFIMRDYDGAERNMGEHYLRYFPVFTHALRFVLWNLLICVSLPDVLLLPALPSLTHSNRIPTQRSAQPSFDIVARSACHGSCIGIRHRIHILTRNHTPYTCYFLLYIGIRLFLQQKSVQLLHGNCMKYILNTRLRKAGWSRLK